MSEKFNIEEYLNNNKLSPMFKEYLNHKTQFMDCILLYEVGDFHEAYFNDAEIVSKELNIKLTKKSCGVGETDMCGVPTRSLNNYLNRLSRSGHKVVVVKQLESASNSTGKIVKRGVTDIITPGTLLNEDIEFVDTNYLASIIYENNTIYFSYVDITAGDIYASSFDKKYLREELAKVQPKEILIQNEEIIKEIKPIIDNYHIYLTTNFDNITDYLNTFFNSSYLKKLELHPMVELSLNQLLSYVFYVRQTIATNIDSICVYKIQNTMGMDSFTRDSLELTRTLRSLDKKGSLFSILDKTKTAMGGRKLKEMIEQPLVEMEDIEYRQNLIKELVKDTLLLDNLIELINPIYDIERICGKIAFDRVLPSDLVQLRKSIKELPFIKHNIHYSDIENKHLGDFIDKMDDLIDIYQLLDESILEEPKNNITEGDIIKSTYNLTLKKYRDIINNSQKDIEDLENKIRKELNCNTLKISKNEKDGHYIDITRNALKTIDIPDNFTKIKELNSNIRFMCPELRELELNLIEALDKSQTLEYSIFKDIRQKLIENVHRMKETSKILAELDAYLSLAKVAILNNYVKPNLNNDKVLNIKNGRHPVVEIYNKEFIGNDIFMDNEHLIQVITGPNMSGKSTYMRQTALIVIMAQIGSFVPCDYANISVVDRLFTRIGASDNLANGQSTFMVEMSEVSQILNQATTKSLILLDELGRGTSTYDGISLAWSILEYIQSDIKCQTLCSTHYFELTELEKLHKNIHNYKIDIKENNGEIEFLRKVIPGASTKSYGIYVAKQAGVPLKALNRASEILIELENKENKNNENLQIIEKESQIEKEILSLNINNMTPMELFQYIYNLQLTYNNIKKGDNENENKI